MPARDLIGSFVLAALLSACSSDPASAAVDSSGEGSSSTAPLQNYDFGPPDPHRTDCAGFICQEDPGNVHIECDIWAQDCPAGEKCMPWANDGGSSWNATRCSPLDPTPAEIGAPCMVMDSGVSGIDDCPVGAMCWNVDPATDIGECIDFCQGSEANPICADPAMQCSITDEGVLIPCLPSCDPLAQDCYAGQACYPIDTTFVCAPDASGEMGAFGEPCEYLNVCDPGLFCAAPEAVPDCEGSQGCCTELCDLSTVDPDSWCTSLAEGMRCIPWYALGQAPPGFVDVGACLLPE